jgi:glycosyltransferase involved in cell wall biosynthesis
MSTSATVAVIIPCFNTARFVQEAIESALAQTYRPLEVVVVNDGSTDGFHAAVAPFAKDICIVDQDNRGLAAARNRGIEQTSADMLAFLDADDRWHPEKLERQVAVLERAPDCCLVHTAARYIDAVGNAVTRQSIIAQKADGDCLHQLIRHNTIVASSVLLRRSALGDDGFAPGLQGVEDWDLWLRLAKRGRFTYLDAPLLDYRLHATNMSKASDLMLRNSLQVMERTIRREPLASLRHAAQQHRNAILMALAGIEYEQGNLGRARKLFLAGAPSASRADLIRFASTFLPARVHPTARNLWRGLQEIRSRRFAREVD